MLKQEDIHITALPIEGESRYILNQVDKVLGAKNPRLPHVEATLANLIDYIVAEFVAPNATDSLLSLYLGSKDKARDVTFTNRLSELADLCAKLQELSKLAHVCVRNALVGRIVRALQSTVNRKKWTALRLLREKLQERPTSPRKQIPRLPFIDQKGKGPSPPLPGSINIGKSPGPPGKGTCPPLPLLGKSSGPPVPMTGKVSSPPTIGKGTSPPIPTLGKGTSPPTPSLGKGAGPPIPSLSKGTSPPIPSLSKGTSPPIPSIGKGSPPVPAIPIGKTIPVLPKSVAPNSPGPSAPLPTIFQVPLIDSTEKSLDTRKLHWQSIPVNRFKNSVFESQLGQVSLDLELIKSHFVKAKTGMFSPTNSPSRIPTAANSPIATSASLTLPSVLETKRIQQIEIFLNGRKGLTCSDIVSTLKSGGTADSASVVDLLEAVLAIYPSEDERTALAAQTVRFKESNGALAVGKADAFLIDLIAVPELRIACNYVIILHTAETATGDLAKYFANLNTFLDSVVKAQSMVRLLSIVGSVVVYLWNGKKSHFNGFTVEMTSQLKKVSSFTDRDYSMLHYVVEELSKDDSLTQVLNVLSHVETLLDWDFADAVQRADEVERSVRAIKPNDRLNGKYYPALIARLNGFKDHMETKLFVQLESEKTTAIDKAKHTLQYFAESDKKSVNEFLVAMNTLRLDLTSAKSQLEKRTTANRPAARK